MKSIKLLACVILAAVATGCATVELSTEGNGNGGYHDPNDIMQKLAHDSQGGDS